MGKVGAGSGKEQYSFKALTAGQTDTLTYFYRQSLPRASRLKHASADRIARRLANKPDPADTVARVSIHVRIT